MSQEFATPNPNPGSNRPAKPDLVPPAHHFPVLTGINMAMLLASLALLGYLIYEQSQASKAAKPIAKEDQKAEKTSDDVKPEVAKLKEDFDELSKKMDHLPIPPDPATRLKMLDDRTLDVSKSLGELSARFDALDKKPDAVNKVEGLDSSPKLMAIEQKVGSIAAALEALKAQVAAKPASAATASSDMDRAVDLFKKGKYAEAKDAFAKLQGVTPDDARVWYYSALATGLATGDWKGESERLVALGAEKEKAGKPDRAKINAAFAELTTSTGKDWLAYYRGKAAP